MAESLQSKYGTWGEHPQFSEHDWREEVANRDTRRGYWDWVQAQIESDEFEKAQIEAKQDKL